MTINRLYLVPFLLLLLNLVACSTASKIEPVIGEVVAEFPKMSVGDTWVVSDHIDEHGKAIFTYQITSVDSDGSFDMREEHDKSSRVVTRHYSATAKGVPVLIGRQFDQHALQFPLFVGKSWKTEVETKSTQGELHRYASEYFVDEYTTVETAVGSFDAFRIKQNIISKTSNWRGRDFHWYAPAAKVIVKTVPSQLRGVKLLSMELIE